MRRVYRDDPILGRVKRCPRCRESWPLDSEFFFFRASGKPQAYCKACYNDAFRESRSRRGLVHAP